MKFTILGQGTAVPPHFLSRDDAVDLVRDNFCRTDRERRIVPALYRMSGVKKRHSVLLTSSSGGDSTPQRTLLDLPVNDEDMGPGVGLRMAAYEQGSTALALESTSEALANANVDALDITHLVTVSCSGFAAPGVDIHLIRELGLRPTVERTHVGFMGCHGALNGLRAARAYAEADPSAVVLMCAVEVCSVHYHYGWDPEQIVANALFADGSASVVGAARPEGEGWQIGATGACLIPDSEDAMTWRIGDHGFVMSLSPQVPQLIEKHLRPWTEQWLHGGWPHLASCGNAAGSGSTWVWWPPPWPL
ncbi:MAG: type III polyketide synthase [Acidobacteria bacterium]|nr:type III polyketide synthase [Acidobacteriota bacterium]